MKSTLQKASALVAFTCAVPALFVGSNLQAAGSVTAWGYYYDLTIPETYRPMYVPPGLTNVIAVAGGYNHALALKSDGKITAWGWNGNGQTNVPTSASNVVAIVAGGGGSGHSLALRNDGKVIGWGYSGFGAENVPSGLSNVVAIASYHALKADGTVVAWGANLGGQASVPAGLERVIAITDGFALKEDGTVTAWDYYGNTLSNVPSGLSDVVAIARGGFHFLALKSNGVVVAWGDNSSGQTNIPVGLSNVVSIAAGNSHCLAVKSDGAVTAWGAGTNYVADLSNRKGQSIVPSGITNAVTASGGSTFSLAILGDGSPFLTRRLFDKKVAEGTALELRIGAAGAGLLSYQWKFFGTNIPGATNSSFYIPEVLLSHSGPYSVDVSNSLGSASSSNILEVVPILIVSNPTNQVRYMWGDTTLSVVVRGRDPLLYQWKFNGINIPGQTNSLLQLTNLQFAQIGNYTVAISNSVGFAVSQTANLSLSQVAVWGGQTIPQGWTNIVAIAAGEQGSLVLRANGTMSAVGFSVTNGLPAFNDVIAIAAGGKYADGGCGMALRSNGTMVVWGDTRYDQQIIPNGLSNIVAIAAGGHHCLALRSNGTVVAWGWNGYGQATIPNWLSNVIAIAGGYDHSLVLKADGSIANFGNIASPPPYLTNVVAIAAGYYHEMALRSDGTVVAWGGNSSGQTNVPAGLSNVVAIAAGSWHSIALKRSGEVVVWGHNSNGQTNVPTNLPNAASISAGGVHSLALLPAQGLAPFLGPSLVSRTVAENSTTYLSVNAGGSVPLVYQWRLYGTNLPNATNATLELENIQLNQGGTYSVVVGNTFGAATNSGTVNVVPLLISVHPLSQTAYAWSDVNFTAAALGSPPITYQWRFNGANLVGATNSALVLSDLQLNQAGAYSVVVSNASGSMSSAEVELKLSQLVILGFISGSPPLVTNGIAVACGREHDLLLRSDSGLQAWGGANAGSARFIPSGISGVIAVACGEKFNLVLRSNGTVAAWGDLASFGATNVPPNLSNIVAVACGTRHSLALRADGAVTAWGWNNSGQTNVPVGLSNVVGIAAGFSHSLTLRGDGSIVAWGSNSSGQTNVPLTVTNAISVAAGLYHSLALTANGEVIAWGDNSYGQLNVPTNLANVIAIACGDYHSVALRSDSTVAAWGNASEGKTDVPIGLTNVASLSARTFRSLALIGSDPVTNRMWVTDGLKTSTNFSLRIKTLSGRVYALEYTDTISGNNWVQLPLVAGNGFEKVFVDPSPVGLQRFYRVRQW